MEACAVAKFNPSFYGSSESACKDCQKGRYCPDEGMDDLSNSYCTDGYICNEGSDVPAPTGGTPYIAATASSAAVAATGKGYECPAGKKCPALVIHELKCEDGRKSITTGQANCQPCEYGFYCD